MTVMHKDYTTQLINLMYELNDESSERIMRKYRKIGKEIYKIGGTDLLFGTMDYLMNILIDNDYYYYLINLREIEVSWNGIGEWQA